MKKTYRCNRLFFLITCLFVILQGCSSGKKNENSSNKITSESSPVTLTIDTSSPGKKIPDDFVGESFEAASLRLNNNGVKGHFFDAKNKQLLTLFRELGIKNLRIGGATVDFKNVNPTHKDIDALFSFAKAAGLKVIYSLRLLNGNAEEDARTAKYVWDNYRKYLVCFAIGNEPDWHSYHHSDPQIHETKPGDPGSAYPSYLAKWRSFADAVLKAVPEAKFTGPDTGSNYPVQGATNTNYKGKSWTVNFANDEKDTGIIKFVSGHNYVGEDAARQKLTPQEMIDQMLSPKWDNINYPTLYKTSCTPALPAGMGYRLTESNSFSGGVKNGSNCFATALFALDYLHWWSEHNCLGINFHTTQWRYNGTFYHDENGNFHIYPMGYGIKAFSMGGHGETKPVSIANEDSLNLTAYAVENGKTLYVTIINKSHDSGASNADVTIKTRDFKPASVSTIVLTDGKPGDGSLLTATLGGAKITNDAPWQGKWSTMSIDANHPIIVNVKATTAEIVKITTQ